MAVPWTWVERCWWTAWAVVGEEVETLMTKRVEVVGEMPKRRKEVAIWMGGLESGSGRKFAGRRRESIGNG